ncbi:Retrovirus-related Pol polyprotein from transposon TNT 1-94 [Gossypium australe]|uniref:Retrovirus-related Pol polyprotein from transposon TNT 1-94 n=1 Tax=Gossypium australe TaxID=47621 RepID=A0A5B6VE66_9ROSI|nr:Retrovirus-related Pol polyprotein from transposon TNT 1-94 [Gossypium australe]
MKEGFEKCDYEHTLFIKRRDMKIVMTQNLYVDDLIISGNDEQMIIEFKNSMNNEFDMIDLERMRYFFGIEVLQKSDGIFIS